MLFLAAPYLAGPDSHVIIGRDADGVLDAPGGLEPVEAAEQDGDNFLPFPG